jgi:hypothetical protein
MFLQIFIDVLYGCSAEVQKTQSPRHPGRLNSVQQCLIFVGPYYGICSMSKLWRLEL